MPKNIIQYSLLISCPGDVQDEVDIIEKVVRDFNNRYTDQLGISIQTKYWKKNSYPQSGGKPQALLNEQFVKRCDLAIGILWTRFGTPTDQYGSGTEEEINIMLDANKQVFMYFSEKPINPSQIDVSEYKRVQEFKKKYQDKGIYYIYASDEEFEQAIAAHLAQHFLTLQKIEELNNSRIPKLQVKGISSDGLLIDSFYVEDFPFLGVPTAEDYKQEIRQLYNELKHKEISKSQREEGGQYGFGHLGNLLEISEDDKKLIIDTAEELNIDISDEFFFLGDLKYYSLPVDFDNYQLIGSSIEKEKYSLLKKLKNRIHSANAWKTIRAFFKGVKCTRLALQNGGNAIDEDVEIEMTFSKKAIVLIDDLLGLERTAKEYLVSKCNMKALFGIPGSRQYKEYSEINDEIGNAYESVLIPKSPFSDEEYDEEYDDENYNDEDSFEEDYYDQLKEIFDYAIYEEDGAVIIKVKFDYIKHHTAVAFPSILLLRESSPHISYEIKSKYIPEIQHGLVTACATDDKR